MEVYLDNAATSHPKPPEVLAAVQEALTGLNGNPGRSGHARALSGSRLLMKARESLAYLLHASRSEDVVFCFNGTDALNTAIKGSLQIGDHVITSALEHNSVLRVLEMLRRRGLITVTMVLPEPDGMIDPDRFRMEITPKTRLCILTHISNVTGAIQPVAAVGQIMRSHGVRYLIDGAQAIGHIPVDVQALQCDLYAFPGHKGLLGPQGTGGLYIAPETPLRPFREGGTGSASDSTLQPSERPEGYESGTVNLPGISGLNAGVRLITAHQREYLLREQELTDMLWRGLSCLSGVTLYSPCSRAERTGVISFNVGSLSSSEAADRLAARGIAVRGGLHCAPEAHRFLGTLHRGAVRASISWQNTPEDIEALLRTVRSFS